MVALNLRSPLFQYGHLANEIGGRKTRHICGFVVACAVREMARSACAHLRILVAELNDLRHRRVPVRKPVRDVVHVVRLGPRDRQRAPGRRWPHASAFKTRSRQNLLRHGERPIGLVRCRCDAGHKYEREDADDVPHDTSQFVFSFKSCRYPERSDDRAHAFTAYSIVKRVECTRQPNNSAPYESKLQLWLCGIINGADVRGDNSPALGKSHPGLHRSPNLARLRSTGERGYGCKIVAVGGDDGTLTLRPRPRGDDRASKGLNFRMAVSNSRRCRSGS